MHPLNLISKYNKLLGGDNNISDPVAHWSPNFFLSKRRDFFSCHDVIRFDEVKNVQSFSKFKVTNCSLLNPFKYNYRVMLV